MNKQTECPPTGMQRARRIGTRLAVALPLTLAAAGAVTFTTSVIDAPPAAAWGLGDITKAAKKVGGAVGDAAKRVAKDAHNSAKIVGGKAKKVGKGAAANARDFGGALKRDLNKAGGGLRKAGGKIESTLETGAGKIGDAAKAVGGAVKGKIVKKFDPPEIKPIRNPAMEQGLEDFANGLANRGRGKNGQRTLKLGVAKGGKFLDRRGNAAAGNGIRKTYSYRGPSGTLKPGIVKNNPSRGDYTGGYREKIGNDKSVWGRPIYRNQRPNGETQKIGNDKSMNGRPVYGKRPGKPNRKVQGIRLGDIKPGAQRTRELRRKNGKFTKDRRFKRDRKRFTKDRKFKRDRKRFTKDRKFKRDRKRMSRQFRNDRKSRGFRMKRNRNRGNNRRRNNRRNR